MKILKKCLFLVTVFGCGFAQASAPDADELTRMLNEFLAGASVNDLDAHRRFWADDLIYTSSAGLRLGKTDIVDRNTVPDDPEAADEPEVVYSAEDIRIQQYGVTAIVAFRLVARQAEPPQTLNYFNTGTFLKREGRWQVVAWQATRIPEEE
jgi:hypothetical protein